VKPGIVGVGGGISQGVGYGLQVMISIITITRRMVAGIGDADDMVLPVVGSCDAVSKLVRYPVF